MIDVVDLVQRLSRRALQRAMAQVRYIYPTMFSEPLTVQWQFIIRPPEACDMYVEGELEVEELEWVLDRLMGLVPLREYYNITVI